MHVGKGFSSLVDEKHASAPRGPGVWPERPRRGAPPRRPIRWRGEKKKNEGKKGGEVAASGGWPNVRGGGEGKIRAVSAGFVRVVGALRRRVRALIRPSVPRRRA